MQLGKFLSNISGFSMTELMVGVGLLGGVSVVTMRVMENQASNEAQLKWSAAVNRAALQIQNTINNGNRCNEMLVGRTREATSWPTLSGPAQSALQIAKGGGQYEVLLAPGMDYSEGFYIPPDGIRLMTSPNGAGITELVIVFQTRSNGLKKTAKDLAAVASTDKKTIIKRIPFVTTLNGNQIKSCGPVVADDDLRAKKRMCDALGGAATWNAGTATCTINPVNCPAGQVPIRMTSLGNLSCGPVTNADLRDQLFDFGSTTCPAGQGVTLTVGADGKIKAGCTGNTGSGCPAMATITWYSANASSTTSRSQCAGSIGAGGSGSTVTVSDGGAPTTGSAQYTCTGGAWKVVNGTESCLDSSKSCAATTVRWSGATKFCEATASAMVHGQGTVTISDGSNNGGSDGTGTAVVECSNGSISIVGNVTCN